MTVIISAFKIFLFLFPFVKEVFVKKERPDRFDRRRVDRRTQRPRLGVRQSIIIVMGCMSVAFNFYIVERAYNLGKENILLKKQISEAKSTPPTAPDKAKCPIPKLDQYPPMPPYTPPKQPKQENKPTHAPPREDERFLKELQDINKIN
jgi:hypothetical protein